MADNNKTTTTAVDDTSSNSSSSRDSLTSSQRLRARLLQLAEASSRASERLALTLSQDADADEPSIGTMSAPPTERVSSALTLVHEARRLRHARLLVVDDEVPPPVQQEQQHQQHISVIMHEASAGDAPKKRTSSQSYSLIPSDMEDEVLSDMHKQQIVDVEKEEEEVCKKSITPPSKNNKTKRALVIVMGVLGVILSFAMLCILVVLTIRFFSTTTTTMMNHHQELLTSLSPSSPPPPPLPSADSSLTLKSLTAESAKLGDADANEVWVEGKGGLFVAHGASVGGDASFVGNVHVGGSVSADDIELEQGGSLAKMMEELSTRLEKLEG